MFQDGPPSVVQDAQFELASILMETAIWLIKYGARITAKEDINETDAKTVHKSFKQAGGIFERVRMEAEKLLDPASPGSDMDSHIIGIC